MSPTAVATAAAGPSDAERRMELLGDLHGDLRPVVIQAIMMEDSPCLSAAWSKATEGWCEAGSSAKLWTTAAGAKRRTDTACAEAHWQGGMEDGRRDEARPANHRRLTACQPARLQPEASGTGTAPSTSCLAVGKTVILMTPHCYTN